MSLKQIQREARRIRERSENAVPYLVALDIAKRHLAELRRARGRTVGYVEVITDANGEPSKWATDGHDEVPLLRSSRDLHEDALVARVVLVRRGRGGR